jgi:predicted secreted protein
MSDWVTVAQYEHRLKVAHELIEQLMQTPDVGRSRWDEMNAVFVKRALALIASRDMDGLHRLVADMTEVMHDRWGV